MYKRISKYVPGHDGTLLAVDLYLPETEEKVPVVFQMTNGERRPHDDDEKGKKLFQETLRQYEWLLENGYAVCRVEPRGVGASFGVSEGFWSPKDGKDIAAVIDAVAAENWCNGNAGMYGGSNVGSSQHLAAMNLPKALRCIIPCDCSADFYYQNYPNGVSILPVKSEKRTLQEPRPGTPVDDDPDGSMALEAMKGHRFNMGFLEQYTNDMHRDDVNPQIGYAPNMEIPVWEKMKAVRFSDIATYPYGAFYEPGCTSKIFEYRYWGGKLLLGPWRHCEVYRHPKDLPEQDFNWEADHLEFFDRYLKNIDNDATKKPPVYYYTTGDEHPWHYSADFPLDSQTNPCLRLTAEGEIVDGPAKEGKIDYKVRNDIQVFDSMGRLNRRIEKDMSTENEKCVCFTTAPLEKDLEITGFPVVELYVTSTYKDGIFLGVLEEVAEDGTCRMLTDGCLRARSAKIGRHELLEQLGVPYHSSLKRDDVELSATVPMQLAFHLEACSFLLKKGSRLRLAVYCGGAFNNQPVGMPDDVTVTFHFGGENDSFLKLPVIAPNVTEFVTENETVYAFKRAVYRKTADGWNVYPCVQAYPAADGMHFVTNDFTAIRSEEGNVVTLNIPENTEKGVKGFTGSGLKPDRLVFSETSTEIIHVKAMGAARPEGIPGRKTTFRNLYVASVPEAKGSAGHIMNLQMMNTMDLFVDVILPEGEGPFPCIVSIHGSFGTNHEYERICADMLDNGYAVASVDYRSMPPNVWPVSGLDTRGCIRYLKAHAAELKLDPNRFGYVGCSMGGQLTSMLAACNGDPAVEGDIGGNTEFDSSAKAVVTLFPPTDLFAFGLDCGEHWPHDPAKIAYGDGPFSGCSSFIGYVGPGKGIGELRTHMHDSDPFYQDLIALAKEASPINHVTKNSAPLCLVHGLSDCGIQVPMGQSVRMFEAYTRVGVKSLLLLNNNGFYGEDPEVQKAMVDFFVRRV